MENTSPTSIEELVAMQRIYFNTHETRSIEFRKEQLKKLDLLIRQNESVLVEAIFKDLKKSKQDTIITELSLIYHEIAMAIRKLRRWSARQRKRTNLINFPGRSYLLPEPYGVVYIAGAWNYPYQLTLLPLVSAMTAGNTAIIKPSELVPHTSQAIARLINENFPIAYIHVLEGDATVASKILEQRFDKIFFTGGTQVGKIVYEAAAKHLTPVTLELGGKNPAIVLSGCNIDITAKRLVWGKFMNAGQTCVAPDYVLVHASVEERLLTSMKLLLDRYYNTNEISENFMAIVNLSHFERLVKLIEPSKVYYGGNTNPSQLFISPTLLHNISFDDEVMKEEIFGPILPVIRYDDLQKAVQQIKKYEKPLSFYVYGKRSALTDQLFNEQSFGGGMLNDSVLYFANQNLPFGGIGASGMGAYHGYEGFKTFSHYKSILEKGTWAELWFLKSTPYKNWKLRIMRYLMEKL